LPMSLALIAAHLACGRPASAMARSGATIWYSVLVSDPPPQQPSLAAAP